MKELVMFVLIMGMCFLISGCFDSVSPENKKILADKNVENVALAKEIKELTDMLISGGENVNIAGVLTALDKAKTKLAENLDIIGKIKTPLLSLIGWALCLKANLSPVLNTTGTLCL